jgi:hypothetical protein
MPDLDPAMRTDIAKLAAHERWSQTEDRTAATAPRPHARRRGRVISLWWCASGPARRDDQTWWALGELTRADALGVYGIVPSVVSPSATV